MNLHLLRSGAPRPHASIHRSAWNRNSRKFAVTAFSEVHLCGILRKFSMTTRNTSTAGLIWGSLWRASLYGMLLGAGLGGLYGASLGTLLYSFFGIPFGLFFGAIEGRRGSYNDTPIGPRVLRQLGATTCAVAALAALFVDWLLSGLPDPDGFATSRILRLLLSQAGGYSGVPTDAFTLTIWVFAPMSVAFLGSWLTGRFVAGWYAGTVCPPHPLVMALSSLAFLLALFTKVRGIGILGSSPNGCSR